MENIKKVQSNSTSQNKMASVAVVVVLAVKRLIDDVLDNDQDNCGGKWLWLPIYNKCMLSLNCVEIVTKQTWLIIRFHIVSYHEWKKVFYDELVYYSVATESQCLFANSYPFKFF